VNTSVVDWIEGKTCQDSHEPIQVALQALTSLLGWAPEPPRGPAPTTPLDTQHVAQRLHNPRPISL
jgi:hypothetical protein